MAPSDAKNRIYLQDLLLRLWEEEQVRKTIFFVTHDIEEALYLADRILVVASDPGRIRQEFAVPFERPRRRIYLINDPQYIKLRSELLSLLQSDLLEQLRNVEGGDGI